MIRAMGTLPDAPIDNYYMVDEEGMLDLGADYGKVRIAGLSVEEAVKVVTDSLKQLLSQPEVTIQLARTGGTQQITGIYLVQQDGIINLRQYGVVRVAGKTLAEAREAIEKQLQQYFDSPEVGINVSGYNSQAYYVVRDLAGRGEDVVRIPVTGNETVLDAIGAIGGMNSASSMEVWISRPVPGKKGCEQILPVDYMAITRGGSTATNYQLLPNDRLYIAPDELVAANSFISKTTDPILKMLNTTYLTFRA
ncbi:MAG: polysaccharide biosynthesis/export family protein, partial [Thermoguttaceae bacterium]